MAQGWNSYWYEGRQWSGNGNTMCDVWKLVNVNVFALQRAVCSGSGPCEGTGWSWGLSLCLMLEHTPAWPRTEADTHRKTTHSRCRVNQNIRHYRPKKWYVLLIEELLSVAFSCNLCPTQYRLPSWTLNTHLMWVHPWERSSPWSAEQQESQHHISAGWKTEWL